MKVILLKDVSKLGRKYDVKDVSSGHALNLLIPQGFAVGANPDTLKKFEKIKAATEGERKIHEDLLAKNLKDLDGKILTISGKANEKGHLFAGLHRDEITAELLKQTELQIDPSFVMLDHPIKELGEHTIDIKGGGKSAKLKVVVEAE